MAILNQWQKLTRVLPGKIFGNGSDGAYSSTTMPTMTVDSCSGSATSTTLTTAGSTFANGDVLLIHQSRGTGAGQWEVNRVSSGGGTTSLTLQTALNYTYTDSGSSQAQAIKIPQYTNVSMATGTWSLDAWDKNTKGILVFACKGTFTLNGTVNGTGKGYIYGVASDVAQGQTGESATGDCLTQRGQNGAGGGGGLDGGGGGGGYANSGATGSGPQAGAGGDSLGSADLSTIYFGAGGGGAGGSNATNGGTGGGTVIIFAKDIAVTGSVAVNGNGSSNSAIGTGGSGAGGSVLIVCQTATLGSNLITSLAGTPGTGTRPGGQGSVGMVAVHHSGTISGTTNPTFTNVLDTILVENNFLGAMI